ncbi:hypothetical protein GFM14_09180 [Rhizobium leguminosarum bv. viciae]|uniref:hypothetical protein n=1 Tax=Rhizobium leguminosarum TaxID=384 RepID=UPI001442955A|nr:hypothetical protein [Rhizobium leguminosarum]NKJ91784.1 hypothetical protein [Rhizobium leguminosarum bv. viciae]
MPTGSVVGIVSICAALTALSGCADYMNHRDTITFGAGNAMEANKAIHTSDPFNPQSQNTAIYADGRRVGNVMRDYNGEPAPSQQGYGGSCPSDGNTATDGSNCGGRSAASRAGGY